MKMLILGSLAADNMHISIVCYTLLYYEAANDDDGDDDGDEIIFIIIFGFYSEGNKSWRLLEAKFILPLVVVVGIDPENTKMCAGTNPISLRRFSTILRPLM